MTPTRSWVLAIGSVGAVLAAAHAYTFRVIGESVSFLPDDIGERLMFFAGAPALFHAWIFSAVLFEIALIAMLPAMWLALGRRWPATAVVGLVFLGCAGLVFGDGSQFPTLSLATRYASAPEALRPGIEAAAIDVNAAVVLVLGAAQIPLLVGVLGGVVLAAVKRPPGGRWYGVLFLLFWLANIPIPGAIVFGVLNLILFAAFTYATARAVSTETTG